MSREDRRGPVQLRVVAFVVQKVAVGERQVRVEVETVADREPFQALDRVVLKLHSGGRRLEVLLHGFPRRGRARYAHGVCAVCVCVSCDGSVKGVWGVLSKDGAVLQVGPRLVSVLSGAAACVGGFAVLCRWGWCTNLCCCSCACVQEWAWRRLFGCEAVRKRVLADGKHRKQNAHTDDVLCSVQISSGLCLCPDLSPEPSPNPSPPLLCLSPPPSRSPSPFLPLASPTRSGSKTTTPRARDCDTTRRSFASPAAEQAGAVDKGSWGLADGPATRAAPAAAGMQAERQRHL